MNCAPCLRMNWKTVPGTRRPKKMCWRSCRNTARRAKWQPPTGNTNTWSARAGTIRSPIFRGGGVVFGPHPRDYTQKMTKKSKRLALLSSLSSRAGDGDILVIKELDFEAPKTKQLANILTGVDAAGKKTLVVIDKPSTATIKSANNIPNVKVTLANMVTTYDVMWADKILATSGAVAKMEEVFAS